MDVSVETEKIQFKRLMQSEKNLQLMWHNKWCHIFGIKCNFLKDFVSQSNNLKAKC